MKASANAVSIAREEHAPPDVRYREIRTATLALCAGLSEEDCALQSMPDASPAKWHLGHTSWFFETFVLERALPGYQHFEPHFRVLFNSYYTTVGERHPRPERGLISRPGLPEVLAYRAHVDENMQALLQGGAGLAPELSDLVGLGLNHEQQHQELMLTDLKHLFSRNPTRPAYRPAANAVADRWVAAPEWHRYAEGLYQIGHAGRDFAFDNEQPRHRFFLEDFELASRPVTNGEYLAFMADGGYRRPELWLSDGWDAVNVQRWDAPLYWERRDGGWKMYTLHGIEEIDPAAPVCHVCYFEADAYARWAEARLPTEEEWEVAARGIALEGNFVERGLLGPRAPERSANDGKPLQMYGDVWEWTRSAYSPYPGYAPLRGAVGEYNGKFMCNQYVLRGGSCATPQSHIRATYRNFFPPPARWQFSGIRLARDLVARGS